MGVWQKQGIVIRPTSGDLSPSSESGTQEPTVIFEGSAQILSGNVFKMWFTGGNAGIFYAESTDGLTWTRRATAVISGPRQHGRVFKNGSTYYAYNSDFAAPGATIYAYTSPDGIIWTLRSSTALQPTAGAAFDHFSVYELRPFFVDGNGTWHATYCGQPTSTTDSFSTGFATSTDGLAWTKTSAIAAISNFGNADVHIVNGTYVAWGHPTLLGQGGPFPNEVPTDGARSISPDGGATWGAVLFPTLPRTQKIEGIGYFNGQIADLSVLEVAGKTYCYYTAASDGTGFGGGTGYPEYTVNLAIANMPMASLLTTNEGDLPPTFTQTVVDTFSQADENPLSSGGKWASVTTSGVMVPAKLVSHAVQSTNPGGGTNHAQAWYTGASFPTDQYAEITVGADAASSFISVGVRGINGVDTSYHAAIGGPLSTTTVIYLVLRQAGAQTVLAGPMTVTGAVGDVYRVAALGSTISVYQNGVLVASVVDTTLTSGIPSIFVQPPSALPANATITKFAAGTVSYAAPDDLTLPYIGCVSLASGDSGGTQFIGHVKVIGSPRAGVPNPYLGNMYVVTAPGGRDDKLLGEVSIVSGPPAGSQGTDSYLGHIAEE
jgi:hypothetical protein